MQAIINKQPEQGLKFLLVVKEGECKHRQGIATMVEHSLMWEKKRLACIKVMPLSFFFLLFFKTTQFTYQIRKLEM